MHQVSHRLSAAALGAMLLAPGFACAQSTLEMTFDTTYSGTNAELYQGRPRGYNYTPFTDATSYSAPFGPEIVVNTYAYVGTEHDSSAAVQGVVISDAEAAVFNQFLTTYISPNISVAQIAPQLSGTIAFSIGDEINIGSVPPQAARANYYLNASTGSPFYADGTYTYTATYVEQFEGDLTQTTGSAMSFSDLDAVNWLNQMNLRTSVQLDVDRCAGTQCTSTYLTLYGGGTVTVAPVPEADAFVLSVFGLGFVGFATSRRRSVRKD